METAIGNVTEAGLRANVRCVSGLPRMPGVPVGGNGAVAIDHLMEDAATVEIARSQVWQWLHYGIPLSDGRRVTRQLVDSPRRGGVCPMAAGTSVDNAPRSGTRDLHLRSAGT